MRRGAIPVLVAAMVTALVAVLHAPVGAAVLGIDSLGIPLPDLRLEISHSAPPGEPAARSVAVLAAGMVLSPPQEWEALAVGDSSYRIRLREWRDSRLEIDCAAGSVSMSAGDLAADSSRGYALPGVSCKYDPQEDTCVVFAPTGLLSYRFPVQKLQVAMNDKRSGFAISGAEAWQVDQTGLFLYRLRRREWAPGVALDVDAARRTATVIGGERPEPAGSGAGPAGLRAVVKFTPPNIGGADLARHNPQARKKTAILDPVFSKMFLQSQEADAAVSVVRADTVAPKGKILPPPSRWREMEKAAFRRILIGEPCDVLVVPFQVEGLTVDRIERALMTRYLTDAIARATGLHLPNPTLVARALGEGARAISDVEILQLANDLGARTVVTAFVGHDREETMSLKLFVQERRGNDRLQPDAAAARYQAGNIPFSDGQPPSEAFLGILGDLVAQLFPLAAQPSATVSSAEALVLPQTLGELAGGGGKNPVQDAFSLQLLGLLAPGGSAVAESCFERSLVALQGVSPDSPDYRFLKANAYASLQRRPAALKALGTPATVEGSALEAWLNGDLPSLRERSAGIVRPLSRLVARIRLNDLERAYGGDREALTRDARSLVDENRGLGALLAQRLSEKDQWATFSSAGLKGELDANFPIAGQGLEELAAQWRASGREAGEEQIDEAVFNHYHQVLKRELFPPAGGAAPMPGDVLDLIFVASQEAAAKRIGLLVKVQALPEEGLQVLSRYERLYPDHPGFEYLKGSALSQLSQTGGAAAGGLENEKAEIAQKVFFWSDGQTPDAAAALRWSMSGRYALPSYDADYPRRPFWHGDALGDRRNIAGFTGVAAVAALPEYTRHQLKNVLLDLEYTTDDLRILRDLYWQLVDLGLTGEARAVLDANRGRFRGHGLWPALLAQAATGAGVSGAARRVYEQAVADNPLNWAAYIELGNIMIDEGDFAGASRTFLSYPLFHDPGRGDRVALSHAAYGAAIDLLFLGAFQEAIPLLELCVGMGSGSGSEMGARAYLAQMRGDYAGSARIFWERGGRYRHRVSFGNAVRWLHVLGHPQEAKALFDSLQAQPQENDLWNDALVGLRLAGKSDAEVSAWFKQGSLGTFWMDVSDGQPLVLAFLVDRAPNDLLPEFLAARLDAADIAAVWFAQGYRLLQEGRFQEAYRTLLIRLVEPASESYPAFRYAFPALAWAGVKSGHAEEVAALLGRYAAVLDKDFHYHLAQALLAGGGGDADRAIAELRASWYTIDADYPPIGVSFPWYQLLEAAEWLNTDSPRQDYRDLMLRWSKISQRLYPTDGWTYAFEALYTPAAEDRVKSLALGCFLDPNSRRLSGFSTTAKDAAQAWFKENNPFREGARQPPPDTY